MGIAVQVTFDAERPRVLGAFWGEALGYVQQPPPDDFDSWEAAMTAWGLPPERHGDFYALVDPDGDGPRLYFQRVPESKTAKNRLHLDVSVGAGIEDPEDRKAAVLAHAAHLVGLGAVVQQEFDEEEFWLVLVDPEGNEFCVQ